MKDGKLGIALVGLGKYSGGQLVPALQETEHCHLAGVVTGTSSKAAEWQQKYQLPEKNIYNYSNFDSIADNTDIDIIYIALPNSMHAEFSIRASQAGKHVICEKPMALKVEDCDAMIAAADKAGKTLSIGYRLHFEPYNMEMKRLGQEKVFGEVKKMHAGFGYQIKEDQWRIQQELSGGGPLQDVGIYCVQGFCYTTRLEPVSVTAQEGPKTNPDLFKTVEQSLSWQMEMPGGLICEGQASYSEEMNFLRAEAEKGPFELTSAFGYSGQKGYTPEGPMKLRKVNQQANQMDAIALAIKQNRPSPVPGELGKRDVIIIQAIYEAMNTGKRVGIKY